MHDFAIRVEGLSKEYRIGEKQAAYKTVRDSLTKSLQFKSVRSALGRKNGQRPENSNGHETFWALKDVSFEVKPGEVVGIIGRNGAGKSTLLKILSRITEPTRGHADIVGRIGSLLEVGTGFNPELTGRENTFLNGAILGMKREEIKRSFDEIIAFAEVEKFIDTPVKHYSSGMYLRLAFGVAAHLQTDILLVDEVLAVGDAAFQEKCLGKMTQVARGGRTIFFVSHNMSAINRLCNRVVWLKDGCNYESGHPSSVIDNYLGSAFDQTLGQDITIARDVDRTGDGRVLLTQFKATSLIKDQSFPPRTGSPTRFELYYKATEPMNIASMLVAINIRDSKGQHVVSLGNRYTGEVLRNLPQQGGIVCDIPRLPLLPGRYMVDLVCRVNNVVADKIFEAATIKVNDGQFFNEGSLPDSGHAVVVLDHSIRAINQTSISS